MVDRPTHRELQKKLDEASIALTSGRRFFVEPGKVVGELDALGLEADEVWALIVNCLAEIRPQDYTGSRPPQKSYEKKIAGKELFAFAWDSDSCGRKMYLKFVIKEGVFYYVSFHLDRPDKKWPPTRS